jgi:hypothetical protein
MRGRRHCLATAAALAAGSTGHASAQSPAAPSSATLLDGRPFATDKLRGKVVVVNF